MTFASAKGPSVKSRVQQLVDRAGEARESGDTEAYDDALLRICLALELPLPMKPRQRRPLSHEERTGLEERIRTLGHRL